MRARRYPYFDLPFIAMAHRGGAATPELANKENSMAAFQAAVDLGYHYLETDVHTTRDGTLIAFHDPILDRVTDSSGIVAQLDFAELRKARIAGTEHIPTFDDVLEAFPHTRINVDIKAAGAVTPLAEAIVRHRAQDRVCVASFNGRQLNAFRRLTGGSVPTAVSKGGVIYHAYAIGLRWLHSPSGQAYEVPTHQQVGLLNLPVLSRSFIRAAHLHGRRVCVWTINDRAKMAELIDLGVDGIISDAIADLKEVAVDKGVWV